MGTLKLAFAGLGVGLVAKGFLDVAREAENIGVRMRFLTKSTEEAAEATRLLQAFAARSPAEFSEIAAAAPNLLVVAKNVGELNRMLEITGDLSAVSGLSFQETAEQIQRAMSAGIASADRFRERGVSALLGFQGGVSVTAEETKRHIVDMWFGAGGATNTMKGAAEEMARTWDGLVSMQVDKWGLWRKAVMDSGPFDFLKAALGELDANVNQRFGSMEDSAEQFGQEFVRIMQSAMLKSAAAADIVAPAVRRIGTELDNIVAGFQALPPVVREFGLLGAFVMGKRGLIGVSIALDAIGRVQKNFDELERRGQELSFDRLGFFPRIQNKDSVSGKIERTGPAGLPPLDDDAGEYETRMRAILESINERMEANRKLAATEREVAAASLEGAGKAATSAASRAAGKSAMQESIDQLNQMQQSLREQVATFGMADTAALKYRLTQGDLADAVKEAGAQGAVLAAGLVQLSGEYERLQASAEEAAASIALDEALRDQLDSLVESLWTQEEALRTSYARREQIVEQALDRGLISEARYLEVIGKIQAKEAEELKAMIEGNQSELSKFVETAAENLQNVMADTFFNFMQGEFDNLGGQFKQMLDRMVANAMAAQLGDAMFGKGFGKDTSQLGGWLGKLFGKAGDVVSESAEGAAINAASTTAAATLTAGGTSTAAALTAGATSAASLLATGGTAVSTGLTVGGTAITTAGAAAGGALTAAGAAVAAQMVAGATSAAGILAASGGGGASLLSGIGLRANGGPVTAGQPYIVGERRAELFVPDSNGHILPSVPGGGSVVNIYQTFTGVQDARGVRESGTNVAARTGAAVNAALARNR